MTAAEIADAIHQAFGQFEDVIIIRPRADIRSVIVQHKDGSSVHVKVSQITYARKQGTFDGV
jgi:hypothetical protein